ncbi:MAG: CAP domain-containing protein [Solirubrobacteraceae bacterium]
MTHGETESSWSKRRRGPVTARGVRWSLALLLAVLGTALAVPAAQAAGAKRIIAVLNAQRAANGIPAGITENPAWTAACRLHNAYEKRNNAFGQVETDGKPGYTSAGDLIAQTSVLAQGIYWGANDPYDNAPYHLFDLLNPRISSTGAADSEGFGCVEIELGTLRTPPARVAAYSYPGNHRTGVPVSQRADEQPMTPAQTVGLGNRTTGPNLLVYFDGPWSNGSRAQITSARLSSSRGSVALRWLDNTTSDLLAPTGAILIPATPLRAGTTYHVRVAGSVTGVIPGTSIEQALPGCSEEGDGAVACGQPPATACVENFATQQAACGLSGSWAVKDDFSFTTAPNRHGH